MRALVTGATGLVGSHIVERLAVDGWSVRALVRDAGSARWLEALGAAELATADVLDADRVAGAARGCDVIFHAAAAITSRGGWEAYRRLNVDGTAVAIAAAERAGARLLHLSSVAVYGPSARYAERGRRTDEASALGPLPAAAYYARSKRESEAMVLEAHARGRIWATALRPCVVYGPRDRQFVPRVGLLLRLGVAPLVGDGRSTLAIVHAANVADAAVRAVGRDSAGGKAYNAANDFDVSVEDFVRLAGAGLRRRVRVVRVPVGLARVALRIGTSAVALARGRGAATMANSALDFLTRDNPFSSEAARRELGWSPSVTPEVGIPEAFAWWRATRDSGRESRDLSPVAQRAATSVHR